MFSYDTEAILSKLRETSKNDTNLYDLHTK